MLDNLKKKKFTTSNSFFFYLVFSLISSLLLNSGIDQRAVNSGLYLSDLLNLTDEYNLLNLFYSNSYTTIHQFSEIILRAGFPVNFLNYILIFLSFFFNSFGIFLIVKSITRNYLLSLITSILAIISALNLGDLDYPVLILSEHTNGMLGSSLVVFIFGLIGNKNFKLAILFCFICLSSHIVIGLWITFITFVSLFLFNKTDLVSYINKKNILYLFILLIIFLVSFTHFYFNRIDIPYEANNELFKTYLQNWEHHRNFETKINFYYLSFSILLFINVYFVLNFKKENLDHGTVVMLKLLQIHLALSSVIYLIYKFFPNIFHEKLIQLMPTRFFLLHSFFGLFIFFSLLQLSIINMRKGKNFLILIIFILFLFPCFIYANKSPILINLYQKIVLKNDRFDEKFWVSLNSQKFKKGYLLTSVNICSKTIKETNQPLLICIENIDLLNYFPKLINPVSEIIEQVYEIDFSNPPEKNHGGLWYDRSYKKNFEDRSMQKWKNIAKKYNLNGLILPSSWKLNLDKTLVGKNYTYYRL